MSVLMPSLPLVPTRTLTLYLSRRALYALREGGDVDSVAILTPYAGQVRLITRMLRRRKIEGVRPQASPGQFAC